MVSETTHFAIEEEASDLHLGMSLASYRRLNAGQRAAYAAELNRRGLQRREGGAWEHSFISRILRKAA